MAITTLANTRRSTFSWYLFLFSFAALLLLSFGTFAGSGTTAQNVSAAGPALPPTTGAGAPLAYSCSVASFSAAANYAVNGSAQTVAVGDFNRDGIPDLITANADTNNVSLLLGNGAGGFSVGGNFS